MSREFDTFEKTVSIVRIYYCNCNTVLSINLKSVFFFFLKVSNCEKVSQGCFVPSLHLNTSNRNTEMDYEYAFLSNVLPILYAFIVI